jgi:hypothetical protein
LQTQEDSHVSDSSEEAKEAENQLKDLDFRKRRQKLLDDGIDGDDFKDICPSLIVLNLGCGTSLLP